MKTCKSCKKTMTEDHYIKSGVYVNKNGESVQTYRPNCKECSDTEEARRLNREAQNRFYNRVRNIPEYRNCRIEGCDSLSLYENRTICLKHRNNIKRFGTAERPKKDLRLFLMKNTKVNENGCWEWQAARTPGGYGRLSYEGELHYAHRLSHRVFIGPIAEGMWVIHSCDNPPCINPDHIRQGTPKENVEDAISRGRRPKPRPPRPASVVRAWAKEKGLDVGDTGPLPKKVKQAYEEANKGQ